MRAGYWTIPLDEETKKLTAFEFDGNLYHWNVLPMGLKQAPAIFQRIMNKLFGHLKFVIVYLDDIAILSDNIQQHMDHLRIVFDILRKNGIKLRAVPQDKDELRLFLGLVAFVHQFIPNLHNIAKPLYNLLKKRVPYNIKPKCLRAFNMIKNIIQKCEYLAHPDPTREFHVFCDASINGIGGVIGQYDNKNRFHPVSFAAKSFNPTQQNWHISIIKI